MDSLRRLVHFFINNTLNMYGLSFSIIIMVKGTVILLAALLDSSVTAS